MKKIIFGLLFSLFFMKPSLFARIYKKSIYYEEVVKNKIYPLKNKIEFTILSGGFIINQSFHKSNVINGGITYFFNKFWGIGLEGSYVINEDKPERTCIENFYNVTEKHSAGLGGASCWGGGGERQNLSENFANYGPAYLGIREITAIIGLNFSWNPLYGKQLVMLSKTNHFDVFVSMTGGVVLSDYYKRSDTLKNGNLSRATKSNNIELNHKKDSDGKLTNEPESIKRDGKVGAHEEDVQLYGIAGRPEVEHQITPFAKFGIGQKYHFAGIYNFKIELQNYLLIGTDSGVENIILFLGGFGIRL